MCFLTAGLLCCVPLGGKQYGNVVFGLGWYLFWPFGKYVEGHLEETHEDTEDEDDDEDDVDEGTPGERNGPGSTSGESGSGTVRGVASSIPQPTGVALSQHSTITPRTVFAQDARERTPLLQNGSTLDVTPNVKVYGSTPLAPLSAARAQAELHLLSRIAFWLLFICIIAPVMLLVTLICYAIVFTIPMARLNVALLKHLFYHPLKIRFRAAPPSVVVASPSPSDSPDATPGGSAPTFTIKQHRLKAGQAAPSGLPRSTVLLCTYKAVGLQYYKYTIGGVNIFFVNLMALVFFVIFDGLVLLPLRIKQEEAGHALHPLLEFLTSRALIFSLSLASVIPLSYFIGMAVASISAQSSIGMGAVINATFGSIIEIILYSIMLTSGKGRLVEGSIVGSLLAGVLLMPGVSMCSGALKKKEQKFNAKSAGVTSTMLIMAIIGTLTPTLFYQTYGDVRNSLLVFYLLFLTYFS